MAGTCDMLKYFTVPYDSGQRGLRMGAGPFRIVEALGVEAEEIVPPIGYRAEIRTTFELYRELSLRVSGASAFPVVLSGNCGAAIGAAAGIGCERLAVLWFDAHGDYNTPETTDTGFLDGMSMAMLAGKCWRSMTATIPFFAPIDPKRIIHVGGRDWSPDERETMDHDDIGLVSAGDLGGLDSMLAAIRGRADRILVHVDLDVLDPFYGRANEFAAEGGLSPEAVAGRDRNRGEPVRHRGAGPRLVRSGVRP